MGLANELMAGGGGPHWSLERVQDLLHRSQSALDRSKRWLPTPSWRGYSDTIASVRSKASAAMAAHRGPHDSLPAVGVEIGSQSRQAVKTCDACGKPSLQLKKCSQCKSAAYW